MHAVLILSAFASSLGSPLFFDGPEPALARFAMAARSCGFREATVDATQSDMARLVIPTGERGETATMCVMRWYKTHPRLGINLTPSSSD